MRVQTELQASARALSAKLHDAEVARDARAADLEAMRLAHRADVIGLEARLGEASASLAASESALADATIARTTLEGEARRTRTPIPATVPSGTTRCAVPPRRR
jgi:hypothetical protein